MSEYNVNHDISYVADAIAKAVLQACDNLGLAVDDKRATKVRNVAAEIVASSPGSADKAASLIKQAEDSRYVESVCTTSGCGSCLTK